MAGGEVTRDRRRRHTFWIDDRVIDDFAPAMGRYPFGSAALAIYAVLARRADRDGESWPRLRSIAEQAATSERTVRRALHLLELLGLVEVTACYESGSQRQTSNLYTLLTPPEVLPELDPDPAQWPSPARRNLVVVGGNRSQIVADARCAEALEEPAAVSPPGQADRPSPAKLAGPPGQADSPPPVRQAGLEGIHREKDNTLKDVSCTQADGVESWIVEEVGLSNRQVWAAALEEMRRRNVVPAFSRSNWLEPAMLVGRDGETLLLGVRVWAAVGQVERLLPEIRMALGSVLGRELPVRVVQQEAERVAS